MAKADIDFEKELLDAGIELRGTVSENNYKITSYRSCNTLKIPKTASWQYLKDNAGQDLVQKVVASVTKNLQPDWSGKEDGRAAIRPNVKKELGERCPAAVRPVIKRGDRTSRRDNTATGEWWDKQKRSDLGKTGSM